uniref:Uncharacterized protein n=1 Tax=Nomascus leucogenys TaxID=61853 RepID=G1RQ85_NOMLE
MSSECLPHLPSRVPSPTHANLPQPHKAYPTQASCHSTHLTLGYTLYLSEDLPAPFFLVPLHIVPCLCVSRNYLFLQILLEERSYLFFPPLVLPITTSSLSTVKFLPFFPFLGKLEIFFCKFPFKLDFPPLIKWTTWGVIQDDAFPLGRW